MDSATLKKISIDALEEMKGVDIVTMDVHDFTSITDYMIVVTGTSNRHLKSLADTVATSVKSAGGSIIGMEGQNQTQWILLDLGDVIVHLMLKATRELYDLESLWKMSPTPAPES